jgi:hypothetical protein
MIVWIQMQISRTTEYVLMVRMLVKFKSYHAFLPSLTAGMISG